MWFRELEILLVAYTGRRCGEHAALTADRVDADRRRITIDRQIIETRNRLKADLPKGRRGTMFPATTPRGVDIAALLDKRPGELPDDGLVSAAGSINWPRTDDNERWHWTFHSLRHVFATWALNQPGLRIEDVSRLLRHSSTRVTQDIYIHVHDDLWVGSVPVIRGMYFARTASRSAGSRHHRRTWSDRSHSLTVTRSDSASGRKWIVE